MAMKHAHPSFVLLMFLLLGLLPFLFQDPRALAVVWLCNLVLIARLGWKRSMVKAYALVGGVGAVFAAITWLPFTNVGVAYWSGSVPLINYPLQVTDIGVLWALGMGLRLANVALLSMYYLLSTSPREIAMGLRGLGVPFSVSYLLSLIFRFIPLVKNDLATIREAQMVRGMSTVEGNVFVRIKKYGFLLVPLIFSSLKRVQLIANALDAKGFQIRNSHHRFYRSKRWKKAEVVMLLAGVCAVASLFYIARVHPEHIGVLIPGRI